MVAFPCKNGEFQPMSVIQQDLVLLRTYLAYLSNLNISIPAEVSDEMQDTFVSKRKDGEDKIDETWFGTRITVAKGFARVSGREIVTSQDWRRSMEICAEWGRRRQQ